MFWTFKFSFVVDTLALLWFGNYLGYFKKGFLLNHLVTLPRITTLTMTLFFIVTLSVIRH
jgi:hypothetical protein